MTNAELNELKKHYVANGAASPSSEFVASAHNAEIRDADGKRFIDFAGGIGVLNLGHRHDKITAAIQAQLDKVMHTCQTVMPYGPYVQLCRKLCHLAPVQGNAKAMLLNSGAEAIENAIKIARAATNRRGIITFDGGFHGRTFFTMAMTGKVAPYKRDFGPMPGEVYRAPYPNDYHGISEDASLAGIEKIFKTSIAARDVAAIVIEPVQGEGGFYAASPDYLRALRALCDRHGILLIVDEIQSGFGRTGQMFALDHTDVKADIVTMAKSMAAGMPLSAVVGTADLMDVPQPGSLGGTYCGNPLCCAAALAVIDIFETENILEQSQALGNKLNQQLNDWRQRFEQVDNVRNLGAMAAFELVTDKTSRTPDAQLATQLCQKAKEKGLILLSCGFWGNTIRFLMPLTIADDTLNEGFEIIEQALTEIL